MLWADIDQANFLQQISCEKDGVLARNNALEIHLHLDDTPKHLQNNCQKFHYDLSAPQFEQMYFYRQRKKIQIIIRLITYIK